MNVLQIFFALGIGLIISIIVVFVLCVMLIASGDDPDNYRPAKARKSNKSKKSK